MSATFQQGKKMKKPIKFVGAIEFRANLSKIIYEMSKYTIIVTNHRVPKLKLCELTENERIELKELSDEK